LNAQNPSQHYAQAKAGLKPLHILLKPYTSHSPHSRWRGKSKSRNEWM